MIKPFYFKQVCTQFKCRSTLFKCQAVLFEPKIGLSGATIPGQSRPGSDVSERVPPHSPKLQHYKSLTIRLFSIISRTHVGRVLPLCRDAVDVRRILVQTIKRLCDQQPVWMREN